MSDINPEVFQLAHDIIEVDGWTKGRRLNHRGERCITGGIAEAMNQLGLHQSQSLQIYIQALKNTLAVNPEIWNDSGAVKKQDVLKLLLEMADKYRERQA